MKPESAVQITSWDWAQFGLAGLVIGAMFLMLAYVVKMHNSERSEWREDMKHLLTESNRALESFGTKFEAAFRNINKS